MEVGFKISILFDIAHPKINQWVDGTLINAKVEESWYDILDYMPKLPESIEDKLDKMTAKEAIPLIKYDLDDLEYDDEYDGDYIKYILPCTIEIN